jgi:hypothetical protein
MEGVTLSTVPGTHLPTCPQSACLFPTYMLTLTSVSKQRNTHACMGSVSLSQKHSLMEHLLASQFRPLPPPDCSRSSPGWGHADCPGPLSLELLPKTQLDLDPTGLGRSCAIFGGFSGAAGRLRAASFPVYSIYVPF